MIIELVGGPYDGARIEAPDDTDQLQIPYCTLPLDKIHQIIDQIHTGHDLEHLIETHIIELTYQPTNQHDRQNKLWRLQP